jgi:serine/threonine protein kinase
MASDGRPIDRENLDAALRALGESLAPSLRCGPYLLAHHIASGAVGDIFAAARDGDDGRLRYAVKLLRHGPEATETLARFERERRLLSTLRHPAVVQVRDDGCLSDGRVWFAMPLVAGGPIVRECDARCLPLAARLALFAEVCDAVAAAHAAGVIHRDLSDSNVLAHGAAGEPLRPAIVDFGIARALLSGEPRLTPMHVAHRLGTPGFMSPEQWECGVGACDARSDVFALGMLLGLLATGVLPRVRSRTPRSDRRARPADACAPSLALAALCESEPGVATECAKARGIASAAALVQVVARKVDAVVLRACAADPAARHADAGQLRQAVIDIAKA